MIMLQPEDGITNQKGTHFTSSIIKNQAFPIWVISFSTVWMFEKIGSIKKSQSVGIIRKMGRNPIQNHPNSRLMQFIDQNHEILRFSKTGSGCKIPNQLITPRGIVGIFHYWHELHMRKTRFLYIID